MGDGAGRDLGSDSSPDAALPADAPVDPADENTADAPVDLADANAADAPADLADVSMPDQPPPPPADAATGGIDGVAMCWPSVPGGDVLADFEDGTANVGASGGRLPVPFLIVARGEGQITVPPRRMLPLCRSFGVMSLSGRNITPGRGHLQGRLRTATPTAWLYFDAGAYRGVRVALRADRSMQVSLKLPDENTVMSGEPYDHFAATLNVTTGWRVFTVAFSGLRQAGIAPAFPALDPRSLYAFELQVIDAGTFELTIDDITFFR